MSKIPEALKAPYDETKHREAVAELAVKRTAVEDSAKRLDEMFQKTQGDDGKGFTTEEQQTYNNMAVAHKNLENSFLRLENDVKSMEMRDPAKAVERKEDQPDELALMERYIRATSPREADEMLASDDFKGLMTGKEAGTHVPSNSFNIPTNITAKVRSDNASGQEAVDSTTYRGVIDRLLEYGGMAKMAYSFSTNTGEPFIVPRSDQTDQEGEILSNQGSDATSLVTNNIGSVEIGVETVSSKRIAVSNEMIQDSVFDIVGWVERQLVRRIGRLKNKVTTTGLVSTGPDVDAGDFNGITGIAKDSGVDLTNGTISYANLVDLIFSVDPAYRMGGESGEGGFNKPGMGNVGFMFHESVLKTLMKLVDSEGRPLWNVSTRVGAPGQILGYNYVVNQHMDELANTSGRKPILFGDFSYHWLRNVKGLQLFNFWDSNTAPANERHFIGFYRGASDYVGPVVSSKADAVAFADVP